MISYIGYVKLEGIDEIKYFQVDAASYGLAVISVENYYANYVIEEMTITDHVVGYIQTKSLIYS